MWLFIVFSTGLADLPVHCTYKEFLGKWKFTIDLNEFKASLNDPRTFCDRGQPGSISEYSKSIKFEFKDYHSEIFTFSSPNKAFSEQFGEGEWTMVYDEGFIIKFKEKVFNAFFLYYKQGEEFRSMCSKTTKGWARGADPRNHENWACFFAEKIEGSWNLQDFKRQDAFLQVDDGGIGEKKRKIKISAQNTLMPDEGKGGKGFADSSFLGKEDDDSLVYYWNTSIDDIDADFLPESWDWSNISGKSFISSNVMQQGSCGSCYAITTTELLESRLKILTLNKYSDSLSIQYLISCSFYTEGCEGGYPTLLFKLIQEFGICLDSSMPYSASNGKCNSSCTKSPVSISDFYYIGGYYGATSEVSIMKEVRARGPVIIDFNPGPAFAVYKKGIFEEHRGKIVNGLTMRDRLVDWEKVTHSVLLVGWGIENGKKFWKCLNSWGKEWGEQGYFRILRGNDEDSIESMAEAAVPYIQI